MIWNCPNCNHANDLSAQDCAKCGFARPATVEGGPAAREVAFEIFRGTVTTWSSLFSSAAAFASKIGPENLITISHSEDHDSGVVAVWYWKS